MIDTANERADGDRVASEESAAAREAAGIGGDPGDVEEDPAARPVKEGGGGVAEGFEESEEELREHAEHGGNFRRPARGEFEPETETDRSSATYGDADRVEPSEPDLGRRDDV